MLRRTLFANASLKIVSLIIAIVLWLVVLGSRDSELTKEVPIEIMTPADLVVANEVPDKVSFRLRGPKAFLNNIEKRKDDPIRVNLLSAKPGLRTFRFFPDSIQLPMGVKVESINPTAIMFKLEPVRKKEVAVKLVTTGQLPSGFKLVRFETISPTVKVRGAESRVDQVVEVPTVPINLSQLRDSGQRTVAVDLSKLSGVILDGELPTIQFDVVEAGTTYKINNADIKILTDRKATFEPKEAVIYIRCSPEEKDALKRTKVYAVADLRNKGAGTYQPPLTVQLPSNIKLIRVFPAKVKVVLQ